MFRVGFLQFRPRFGEIEKNTELVVERLARTHADLMVLPELAFTGYHFKDRRELESLSEDPKHSATVDALVALCQRRRMHMITGFAERARGKLYNTALVLGPRGIVGRYRKIHLFNEEKRYFDPGNLPFSVVKVAGVRVGTMICFDWAFPEAARALTLAGAAVIAHPSNLVLDYCQRAMLTRSLENGVFSVTVNRFGTDRRPHGSVRFTGRSQIVGPRGELLVRAASQREVLHIEKIDVRKTRNKKVTPHNDLLADRRPRFYRR
jgi:predicted amidohydrolase